jgi:PhnB protein
MSNSHVPTGYSTLTPYITVHDAAAAIDYYVRAFGATEIMRMPAPGGKVMHAEVKIGDSHLMLADEFEEWGNRGPRALGGASGSLMMYVEDADAAFDRAIAEGATPVMPVQDQFYGDRSGMLEDPFGHRWTVAMQKEVLTEEEIARRAAQWMEENMP